MFISQPKIAKHLTKLELLAALTAAVDDSSSSDNHDDCSPDNHDDCSSDNHDGSCLIPNFQLIVIQVCHDLDHPGVNEKYLVSTGSHLAGTNQKKMVVKAWK